jgi:hypothetical protein
MDVAFPTKKRKHEERPPTPCPRCGTAANWNGGRSVAQVEMSATGEAELINGRWRRRACCPNPDCPVGSWTVYESGGYPGRTFTLAVTASAVAQLAGDDSATPEEVAKRHRCDRRTVMRWEVWIVDLFVAAEFVRACARLDSSGLPPPRPPRGAAVRLHAGWMLLLLDHLARLLRERGVALERGTGLVAILRH